MARLHQVYRSQSIDCMIVQPQTTTQSMQPQLQVMLLRREQDASGMWHSTTQFQPDDLPVMLRLLSQAHQCVLESEQASDSIRPHDDQYKDVDRPNLREIHDAIIASQIRR